MSNRKLIESKVDKFCRVSYESHRGYAFSSGYMKSLVKDLLLEIPESKVKNYLDNFDISIEKMKKLKNV